MKGTSRKAIKSQISGLNLALTHSLTHSLLNPYKNLLVIKGVFLLIQETPFLFWEGYVMKKNILKLPFEAISFS
jgi:hypothetical protein